MFPALTWPLWLCFLFIPPSHPKSMWWLSLNPLDFCLHGQVFRSSVRTSVLKKNLIHSPSSAVSSSGHFRKETSVGPCWSPVWWCHSWDSSVISQLSHVHDVITEPVLMKSKPGRASWRHSWAGFVMLWLRPLLWHHSWAQFGNDPWGFYPSPITHTTFPPWAHFIDLCCAPIIWEPSGPHFPSLLSPCALPGTPGHPYNKRSHPWTVHR